MTYRLRLAGFAAILVVIVCAPAPGQDRILASARPPATACPAGGPLQVWLLQQSSATDCDNAVSGTVDALCCCINGAWAACVTTSGGSGTVTSVALAVPAEWSVSGSPVTTSGTITISEATQSANTVYAGPTSGGAAAPGFRAVVDADVPNTITVDQASSASDLSCTNCIGGTEIDESALGAVPTATALAANPGDCSGATNEFAWRINASGDLSCSTVSGTRLPSWNNPPASAHSYDDEFNAGTLDAKWTRSSASTTNPVTTGTIDYTASLTTPITDLTSVPSILMFQSDSSSNGFVRITQTYTPATNETHFFKILSNARDVSANGEGAFYFTLINSTDANEVIGLGSANSGSVHNNYCYVNNNGSISGASSGSYTEQTRVAASYLVLWKKGNDYYCGIAGEDKSLFTVLPVKTKTGVTTFDRIEFFFQTANETPSIVEGLDFYRYKASLDYSLVNP